MFTKLHYCKLNSKYIKNYFELYKGSARKIKIKYNNDNPTVMIKSKTQSDTWNDHNCDNVLMCSDSKFNSHLTYISKNGKIILLGLTCEKRNVLVEEKEIYVQI